MLYDRERDLPVPTPRKALGELLEATFSEDLAVGARVELVFVADDEGVNAREFAAFLDLLDRLYGRLVTGDLHSYSRRREAQVRVSLRKGSLEIYLSQLAEHQEMLTWLVLIRYSFKYLPVGFEKAGAGVKSIAEGYKAYEEARTTRVDRKRKELIAQRQSEQERWQSLRDAIRQDPDLQGLSTERQRQLAKFIDALYEQEAKLLPRARRFIIFHVRKIYFRVLPPKDDESH